MAFRTRTTRCVTRLMPLYRLTARQWAHARPILPLHRRQSGRRRHPGHLHTRGLLLAHVLSVRLPAAPNAEPPPACPPARLPRLRRAHPPRRQRSRQHLLARPIRRVRLRAC